MQKKKPNQNSDKLCDMVVKGMQEKKAENISIINLKSIKNAIADYFIVCSGTSNNHADAIADSIEDEVHKEVTEWPWHIEGKSNGEWILLDYVDVVAHVFLKDKREFFGLEDLWGDAVINRLN